MNTSERIYSKAKKTIFWRDSSSAHHREYVLNPKKLYFGATHQKHIIENISLIQIHNILARITRSTSPRIFSKSKPCCNLMISRQMIHAVIWRFHGRRPMLQFGIFMAIGSCCDLTISWEAVHPVISRFHGRWPMLQFDDFTPDGPCCNLTISRQLAHAMIWRFHARRSILWFHDFTADGPCCNLMISRKMALAAIWRFHGRRPML